MPTATENRKRTIEAVMAQKLPTGSLRGEQPLANLGARGSTARSQEGLVGHGQPDHHRDWHLVLGVFGWAAVPAALGR